MTEKGSDELLYGVADFTAIYDGVLMARYRYAVEEEKLADTAPATDEPGHQFPLLDEPPG